MEIQKAKELKVTRVAYNLGTDTSEEKSISGGCFLMASNATEVEGDISCLHSIKDSLDDPYGSLNTWDFEKKSKANICQTFHGVTCSNNDRVLHIKLASLGLQGQFPLGIENCSSLLLLDLSSNELSGYIPSHIFSLVPSLIKLNLSYNKFSGEIPTSVANLTGLFRLNNNKLSGYIPSDIFSILPSLTTLDLSHNKFSGEIPASIGNCTQLKALRLHNNQLSGYIPSGILRMLTSLGELDLSYNKFSGEIPTSIANLTGLCILRLNNNKLSGYIPSDIFSMLPSLTTLDLSHNKFSGEIPASIGNCTQLKVLGLHNNQLSGYIPSGILRMLTSLVELDLCYNKFFGEIPESICNCTDLQILRLNNNEFTGEIPQQLGKLTRLLEFRIANNLLSGPVPMFANDVCVGNRESYLNNSGLCGGPFEPCDPFHQSFREGLIAGYVFSATFVIVVYISYCVPWTQSKKDIIKKRKQVVAYFSVITRKGKAEEQKQENQKGKSRHLAMEIMPNFAAFGVAR